MHIYSTFIAVVLISLLNFGYSANFKYEGMLTHSFDRFYVVATYEIPKVEHLQFATFSFD